MSEKNELKLEELKKKKNKNKKFERECKHVLLIRVIFFMIWNDKTMFYDMYKGRKKNL